MKRNTITAGLALLLALSNAGGEVPALYKDVPLSGQQGQKLDTLTVQQGADVALRYRFLSPGRSWWINTANTNFSCTWTARSSAGSTSAYAATGTTVSASGHYVEVPLTSTQTGTPVTNWIYCVSVIPDGGGEYVAGTGRLDIVDSAFTGTGSLLTNSAYYTAAQVDALVAGMVTTNVLAGYATTNQLAGYLPLAAGAGSPLSGPLHFGNATIRSSIPADTFEIIRNGGWYFGADNGDGYIQDLDGSNLVFWEWYNIGFDGADVGDINGLGADSLDLSGDLTAGGAAVFEGSMTCAPGTLSYTGTTVATDASLRNVFRLTLTNDATLTLPSNLSDGQIVRWWVKQGTTGGHTLAPGASVILPSGVTNLVLSTAATATDLLIGEYDGGASKFRLTGLLNYGE